MNRSCLLLLALGFLFMHGCGTTQHQSQTLNVPANTVDHSGITLLKFHADWCGPCKMMKPIVDAYASKHPDCQIVEVDVDIRPDVAKTYNVSSIPVIVVTRDEEEIGRIPGYQKLDALSNQIKSIIEQ